MTAAALLRGFLKRLPGAIAGLLVLALAGEIAWLIWVGPILPDPRPVEVPAPLPPPPAPQPPPLPEPEPPVEQKRGPMPAADIARLDRMLAAASKLPPVRHRKKIKAALVPPKALDAYADLASFRDCALCPLMVALPAGQFKMGSARGNSWEQPRHAVGIARRFAIARFEVSERQWQACAVDGYCAHNAGAGTLPVVKVNWQDAQDYVQWLSDKTGRSYRLPSEAEWAYAIRGGRESSRYWGPDRRDQCLYANGADKTLHKLGKLKSRHADCSDRHAYRAPAGSYRPNAFGLRDMAGNVWEWMQDCWTDDYRNAAGDGDAVVRKICPERVIRGGSWRSEPEALRSTERARALPGQRSDDLGFRVAAD